MALKNVVPNKFVIVPQRAIACASRAIPAPPPMCAKATAIVVWDRHASAGLVKTTHQARRAAVAHVFAIALRLVIVVVLINAVTLPVAKPMLIVRRVKCV